MKKLIYPQLALLLLATAACSSDDTPAVPEGAVTLVNAEPQNITVEAPAQKQETQLDAFTGTMDYVNGQTITYQTTSYSGQRIAFITSIGGTASTVAVPSVLTLKNGEEAVNFTVVGWNLNNYQGIGEGIETLQIPGNAYRWFDAKSAFRDMTPTDFSQIINQSGDLKNIQLGANFRGYCSINGAVYTQDMKTFVCCPRGREGEFVVANGVETIAPYSFFECTKLTRIVLPESVAVIEQNAMLFDRDVLAIDILAPTAPKAYESSFGSFARNAQLRVAKGSRATYFPGELTAETPELPEAAVELTAPTASLANNTPATAATYIKGCNMYTAVVEAYAKSLAVYKEVMEYYNSEDLTNAGYVTKFENYVAAKNAYYKLLTEYQIVMAEYKTAAEAVDPADKMESNQELTDAYKAAQDVQKTVNSDYKDCTKLYTDASKKYQTLLAAYENALNDYGQYAGYKFFNADNIKEINFTINR